TRCSDSPPFDRSPDARSRSFPRPRPLSRTLLPPPPPTPFPYTPLFRSRAHFLRRSVGKGNDRRGVDGHFDAVMRLAALVGISDRSEEHTSALQSRFDLVCRLLLAKKTTGSTSPSPTPSGSMTISVTGPQ